MINGFNIGFKFTVNDTTVVLPESVSATLRILSKNNTFYTSAEYTTTVTVPPEVRVFNEDSSEVSLSNNSFTFLIEKDTVDDFKYRFEWNKNILAIPVVLDIVNTGVENEQVDNSLTYSKVATNSAFSDAVATISVGDSSSKIILLSENNTKGIVWSGVREGIKRSARVTVQSIIQVEQPISKEWKLLYTGIGADETSGVVKDLTYGQKLNLAWKGRPSALSRDFVISINTPAGIDINTEESEQDSDKLNYTVDADLNGDISRLNPGQSFTVSVSNGVNYLVKVLIRQQVLSSGVYYGIPANKILKNDHIFRTYTATTTDTLSTFVTGSQTEAQKRYSIQTYNNGTSVQEKIFSVSYGHNGGSGSIVQNTAYPLRGDSETRAIYAQHARVLENISESTQRLTDGVNSIDAAYFIDFNKDQIKLGLEPGVWELTLDELSGSFVSNNDHTGSNIKKLSGGNVIQLIDNSTLVDADGEYDSNSSYDTDKLDNFLNSYAIISGSISEGPYRDGSSNIRRYGRFYPTAGTLVLDEAQLDASASYNTVSSDTIYGENAQKLLTSLNSISMRTFDSEKQVIYIVNVGSKHLNFSTNPSYVTDYSNRFSASNGTFDSTAMQILNKDWITSDGNSKTVDAKTYPTTIGLYDENFNLMAIGKTSVTPQKSKVEELLYHVRLRY